jgi:predicted RNase H-like nuclease (RuvC/YqgF family)
MTQATDTDIRDIKTAIEANTKAIGDLTSSVSSLREEMRVGFANITTQITRLDGKIDNIETRIDGRIDKLEATIEGKFDKLDERTKVGFWGFILRGTVLAIIIGVGGYLLPVVAEYVHKLPNL